ncbi:MAG: hypothetical protein ABSB63_12695 [Spirochaetia bacterium]|jgi:hypothetical protein
MGRKPARSRGSKSERPRGAGKPSKELEPSVSIAPVSIGPVSPRDPISLFELAVKDRLPRKLERFGPLIFLGDTAVTFAKKRFERDKNFEASADQIDASYGECLRIIELYFRAWQRCGELAEEKRASPAEAGKMGGRGKKGVGDRNTLFSSVAKSARESKLSRWQLEQAILIARYPQYIDTVLADARKRRDFPSLTKLRHVILARPPGGVRRRSGPSKHQALVTADKRLAAQTEAQTCIEIMLDLTKRLKNLPWDMIPKDQLMAIGDAWLALRSTISAPRANRAQQAPPEEGSTGNEPAKEEGNAPTEERKGA